MFAKHRFDNVENEAQNGASTKILSCIPEFLPRDLKSLPRALSVFLSPTK
jgi:hypothetical protein